MKRSAFRIAGVVLALFLVAVWYLATAGFPRWFAARILKEISKGNYSIDAAAVKLNPGGGLRFEEARIYRRGKIGPAVVSAIEMVVNVSLPALLVNRPCVKLVSIRDAQLHPAMAFAESGRKEEKEGAPADLCLHLERCRIWGVEVSRLDAAVHTGTGRLVIDGIESVIRNENEEGALKGSIGKVPGRPGVSGDLELHMDPHVLLPVMRACDMPTAARITRRFDFITGKPRWRVHFDVPGNEARTVAVNGAFWFQDFAYNDVTASRSDGNFRVLLSMTNSLVAIGPVLIARRDGMVEGGFTIDLDRDRVVFDAVSGIDPKDLAKMIGIMDDDDMALWRFPGSTHIAAQGFSGFSVREQMDFNVDVSGEGICFGPLESEKCSFTVHCKDGTNVVPNLTGTMYGGSFTGAVTVVLPRSASSNVYYSVDIGLEKAEFGKAAASLAGAGSDYTGELACRVYVAGYCGSNAMKSVTGKGTVRIREGRVFSLPLFGGLSRFMMRVIPGLDFVLRQSDARADFIVGNGVVQSGAIYVEGDILSVTGSGDYGLDNTLDFDVRVQLMKQHTLVAKLLRTVTYPISKLFEFKLHGPLREPHWYPVNFSTDLLEKLGLKDKETGN